MPKKKTRPKKKVSHSGSETPQGRTTKKKTAHNIKVMKSRGAYRGKGTGSPKKKTSAKKKSTRKKPSKANAEVMKLRGAHPFEDKSGAPRSTELKHTDLSSFWSINGALLWIAKALLAEKIQPAIANELRLILNSAAENQKKRLQRHGKWIERSESKDEMVIISAELSKCLERVQGSSPAELKKIQGQVSAIMGAVRE